MMKETGWQQHSVRGFLAGVVRKKLKLKLNSQKIDGSRVYQIAGGDGIPIVEPPLRVGTASMAHPRPLRPSVQ